MVGTVEDKSQLFCLGDRAACRHMVMAAQTGVDEKERGTICLEWIHKWLSLVKCSFKRFTLGLGCLSEEEIGYNRQEYNGKVVVE